jgi:hypothetical protein
MGHGKAQRRAVVMPCEEEHAARQEALREFGAASPQYRAADDAWHACMRKRAAIAAGRRGHSGAWDERLWLLHQEIQEAWERLFGGLDLPPRPCGRRSLEVREEILADRENAMLFSRMMEEAFRKSGIALADDEAFACSVCIVKRPQFVSEALKIDPLGLGAESGSRLNYILEPAIMESALDAIDRDTIDYGTNVNT